MTGQETSFEKAMEKYKLARNVEKLLEIGLEYRKLIEASGSLHR